MPHYFFDTRNDTKVVRDDSGCDLDGLDAASALAVRSLVQIVADELPRCDGSKYAIDVRDADDRLVLTTELTFIERRMTDGPSGGVG